MESLNIRRGHWLFLFPIFLSETKPKEIILVGLKKLEQRNHKDVELRREYVV
jgi:hypothetical protein